MIRIGDWGALAGASCRTSSVARVGSSHPRSRLRHWRLIGRQLAKKLARWAEHGGCAGTSRLYVGVQSRRPIRSLGRKIRWWWLTRFGRATSPAGPQPITGPHRPESSAHSAEDHHQGALLECAAMDHDYLLAPVAEQDMMWGLRTQWQAEARLDSPTQLALSSTSLTPQSWQAGCGMGRSVGRIPRRARADEVGHLRRQTAKPRAVQAIGVRTRSAEPAQVRTRVRMSRSGLGGISALDSDGPAGGRVVTRWNLRVNVSVGAEEPA